MTCTPYVCSLHKKLNSQTRLLSFHLLLVMHIINYEAHPDDPRLDPLIRRVPFPFWAGLNFSGGWPLPWYF